MKNVHLIFLMTALLSTTANAERMEFFPEETDLPSPILSQQDQSQRYRFAATSGETSYLSFNQNRRMSADDGVSFDSHLGELSLTDDVSLSGFTRMNDDEQHYGMGLNIQGSRLTYMQGNGRGFSRLSNQYADLDPYYFHGGTTADYGFDAFEWAHQFGSTFSLQVGTAAIEADHLEDRDTHYVGGQLGAFSGHFMQIRRGGDRAGESLNLGYDSPFGLFNWSNLQHEAGGQMNQVSFSFRSERATQYGLSLSTQENALLDDELSYRVMVSFSRPIGSINHMSAASETNANPNAERNRNIAILGGAAVAAGLLISSGSDSQDNAIRLSDQHAAAREVLNQVNPRSVDENREYGGWVYETPDGNYTSTTPIAGTIDSVEIPFTLIPAGGRALASYHTHGGDDPRYVNEQFSPTDIASNLSVGLDGYLGTPAGNFLWHNVGSNRVQNLGSIAN